jgi:glycosyltransferase involved in cell wall biosynthesis
MKPKSSASQTTDVLILSHVGYFIGGAEKSLLEITKDMRAAGLKVHILLPEKGKFAEVLKNEDIPHSIVAPAWWTNPTNKQERVHSAQALTECLEIIKELKPKVCITNTSVVPSLAVAAAISRTPHIWMLREYAESIGLTFRLGAKDAYRLIFLLSDEVFCNSESLKELYLKHDKEASKIKISYPFVNKPELLENPKVYFPPSDLKLAIVGQVQENKGQLEAVKAVHELVKSGQNVHLAIAGKPTSKTYFQSIESYIEKNNLKDNVSFLGFVDKPFNLIYQADIALTCSIFEAFGRSTIEYMLIGTPVVGSNSGGTSEIIEHGKTGLLYKTGDYRDLASKVQKLAGNKEFAKQISVAAKKDVAQRFGREEAHKELLKTVKGHVGKPAATKTINLETISDLVEIMEDKKTWDKNEIEHLRKELSLSHESNLKIQEQLDIYRKRFEKIRNSPIWRTYQKTRSIYRGKRDKN